MQLEKQTYGLGIRNRLQEFDSDRFEEKSECVVLVNGAASKENIAIDKDGEYEISIIVKEKSSIQTISITVQEGANVKINKLITVEGYGLSLDQNIMIGKDATVTLNKKIDAREAFVFCQTSIEGGENSSLTINEKVNEGTFVRNHTNTTLNEKARLDHTTIFHTTHEHDIKAAAKLVGKESSATLTGRGVVEDAAKGLFLGEVHISKNAAKSQGHQKADVLLLGEQAIGEAVPILEVEHDDVLCSHGATISKIDEQMLFYVMSRGIGKEDAKRLIVEGFLGEEQE